MLMKRRLGEDLVVVQFDPSEIKVRHYGTKYYGKEKTLAYLRNNVLHIDSHVASEFGITVEFLKSKRGAENVCVVSGCASS